MNLLDDGIMVSQVRAGDEIARVRVRRWIGGSARGVRR